MFMLALFVLLSLAKFLSLGRFLFLGRFLRNPYCVTFSEKEASDADSDDSNDIPLEAFEYKGYNYLKDPFQEVYTAEGKMEWVGTYNGKKIVKGDMPERVKKFIEAQD